MFSFVKARLSEGRVFGSEVELQKYLNGLRGYLTRKGNLPRTWKAQQGRILSLYRQGRLKADATTPS